MIRRQISDDNSITSAVVSLFMYNFCFDPTCHLALSFFNLHPQQDRERRTGHVKIALGSTKIAKCGRLARVCPEQCN